MYCRADLSRGGENRRRHCSVGWYEARLWLGHDISQLGWVLAWRKVISKLLYMRLAMSMSPAVPKSFGHQTQLTQRGAVRRPEGRGGRHAIEGRQGPQSRTPVPTHLEWVEEL